MSEIGVPKNPLIAIVDDDEAVRIALQALVRSLGFPNSAFASAEDFLSSRDLPRSACVIADVNMPGVTGLELHHRLIASDTDIPVILVTAYPDDALRQKSLRAGVVGYLSKPFGDNDLLACVRAALERAKPGKQ